MRLKNDKRLRDRLMVPEAYQHPAKGHLGLWAAIIEKYTQPGDVILDPMAGVGSTLIGALMGRDVVCVELEHHFLRTMTGYTCTGFPYSEMGPGKCGNTRPHESHAVVGSWAKMQVVGPMLGHQLGKVLILRGDARCLPLGSADSIVTSPPYEGGGHHGGAFDTWGRAQEGVGWKGGYTRPSAIVTSPPYEGSVTGDAQKNRQDKLDRYRAIHFGMKRPDVLESPTNIAAQGFFGGYAPNTENIGNLRSQAYWDAMAAVYSECHRVLRPQGIMVLVLKGFTRDGKYVDLPTQTKELVENLLPCSNVNCHEGECYHHISKHQCFKCEGTGKSGFKLFDAFKRELWSLSFWRILQKRRDPEAFDERLMFEEVLAFRKNGGEGGEIDAAITSPPFAGSVQEHNVGMDDAWKGKRFGGPQSQARRGGYTTRPGAQP